MPCVPKGPAMTLKLCDLLLLNFIGDQNRIALLYLLFLPTVPARWPGRPRGEGVRFIIIVHPSPALFEADECSTFILFVSCRARQSKREKTMSELEYPGSGICSAWSFQGDFGPINISHPNLFHRIVTWTKEGREVYIQYHPLLLGGRTV